MSSLHIVLGPMFAGKTTYLINTATNLINNGVSINNILVINHVFDTRYSNESQITTHDDKSMKSLSLQNLSTLYELFETEINIETIKYIFIDEGQFFSDLYLVFKNLLLTQNINIYIGGLDGDYKQEPFYESRILDLIPLATSLHKINAKCSICNSNAPFTKRLSTSSDKILIGGSDTYQPVCLNHL